MKNKICTMLLTVLLAGTLAVAGGCGSNDGATQGQADGATQGQTDSADKEQAESTAEEETAEDVDDDGEDELTAEELAELEEDEDFAESPYDSEIEEYFTVNTAEELLKNHKSLLFKETMNNTSGSEIYAYDMFVSPESKMIRYTSGDQEFSESGTFSGYDSELKMPYRYVFYDDESLEEQGDTYDEFLYFWPGEGAEEKAEEGNEVTFSSYVRDNTMLEMLFYEQEEEIEADSYVERKITFNKDTKEFLRYSATYYHADGSTVDVGSASLEFDTEALTPDQEILDKLNSSDSHTITITLDPGTEDEKVLTATVGKGCTFYPSIPDGYIFYFDKDKKEAADEQIWNEGEKDLTLYAYYDEDEDFDGEEIEISEEDLSDIEEDGDSEDDLPVLTEEELQELLENGDADIEG